MNSEFDAEARWPSDPSRADARAKSTTITTSLRAGRPCMTSGTTAASSIKFKRSIGAEPSGDGQRMGNSEVQPDHSRARLCYTDTVARLGPDPYELWHSDNRLVRGQLVLVPAGTLDVRLAHGRRQSHIRRVRPVDPLLRPMLEIEKGSSIPQ